MQSFLKLIVSLALLQASTGQKVREVMRDLIEMPDVTGFDEPVRDKLRAHLPSWTNPEVDTKGNLVVTFGSGNEHLLIVGHLDEAAFVITKINDDGTLSVENRSGLDGKYYQTRPLMIYTSRGTFSGIISQDLHVYLGTETKKDTEELGIKVGDSITIPKRYSGTTDERTGCTAMLLALMRLDPNLVKKQITFAWTVEEAVGASGARALAEKKKADYIFTVDSSSTNASPDGGFIIRALQGEGTDFAHPNDLESLSRMIQHLVLEY